MSQDVLRRYLTKIQAISQAGHATEHSYRPDCRDLLQANFDGISARYSLPSGESSWWAGGQSFQEGLK